MSPKSSGLGQNFYLGGFDLSGDVGSLQRVGGGPALLDDTGLDKSAHERIGGVRDGGITYTTFFNDAAGQAHLALRGLPTTDVHVMYVHTTAVGGAAWCMVGKQMAYDPTRGADGALTFSVPKLANGFGLEVGGGGSDGMLTAGKRVDTAPTNGASIDHGAVSTLFGASAYLQVFALTGTNVILTVQDSADNVTFAAITGLAFTSVVAVPAVERLQTGATATIRRYVRVASSGTFTSATFAVAFVRHLTATL
jgi:hypothetical protein